MGTWLRRALVSMPSELGYYCRTAPLSGFESDPGIQGLFPLSCTSLEKKGRAQAELVGVDSCGVGDWCWVVGVLLNNSRRLCLIAMRMRLAHRHRLVRLEGARHARLVNR